MPSFQPLPWSPSPDDSFTHLAEKLLRDRMGLSVCEPLEQLPRFDSLTDARLWRVGSKYLLKCVPATHHNVETALLARNLLVACQGLDGIPRLIHADAPLLESGHVWMLLPWFSGKPWNPWHIPESGIHDAACSLLKRMHDRSESVLGYRIGELPCVASRWDWLKRLKNLVPLPVEINRMGDLERRLARRLLARQSDFERTMRKMPVNGTMIVIHGDPRPANWIINDGVLSGLIDFGSCRWDHPASDHARLVSGLPRALSGEEMTVFLARTNRWGAMTRWLAMVVESQARWSLSEQQRVEELLKLDETDQ